LKRAFEIHLADHVDEALSLALVPLAAPRTATGAKPSPKPLAHKTRVRPVTV
jgi:hypothetical protein